MSADMYREYILQHYKSPRNYGRLERPDIEHEDDNPLCGDQVHIEVALGGGERIADIRFQGKGCAISQASTSILTEKVKGKTLDEVKALSKEDVFAWLRIPISPMRVKCAILGLMVLQAGVHRYEAGREGVDDGAARGGVDGAARGTPTALRGGTPTVLRGGTPTVLHGEAVMKRTLRLDMTTSHEGADSLELTVLLRVPVTRPEPTGHVTRVSIDYQLEEIRRRMRDGIAAKVDEDNLVIFRLLQAFGIEYWPVDAEDV